MSKGPCGRRVWGTREAVCPEGEASSREKGCRGPSWSALQAVLRKVRGSHGRLQASVWEV